MGKTTRTEIIVSERLKIVHVDTLNWQVFEYREIKKAQDPTKRKRTGESDWIALPAFFGCPESAMLWLARKQFADGGEVHDSLEAAAQAIKQSNKQLVNQVQKAVGK